MNKKLLTLIISLGLFTSSYCSEITTELAENLITEGSKITTETTMNFIQQYPTATVACGIVGISLALVATDKIVSPICNRIKRAWEFTGETNRKIILYSGIAFLSGIYFQKNIIA